MNQIDQARVDACLAQHEVRIAEALVDPFRIEQRGVGEHLGEAVGIDQMPAVFRRRGARTVNDNRCGTVILGGKNVFETQRQLPVVAVIVEVVQDIAGLTEGFVESSLGGRRAVFAFGPLLVVQVVRAQEQLAVVVKGAAA